MILGYLWQCLKLWDPSFFTHVVVFLSFGKVGGGKRKKPSVSFPTGASGGRVDFCNGVFAWGQFKPISKHHGGIYLQRPKTCKAGFFSRESLAEFMVVTKGYILDTVDFWELGNEPSTCTCPSRCVSPRRLALAASCTSP